MFNYSQVNNFEYGCASRGTCSVSPNVGAVKAVMIVLLAQIAFYILKLEKYDSRYSHELLEIIANIDSSDDYSEVQLLKIFETQYSNFLALKAEYIKLHGSSKILANKIVLEKEITISGIIKKGQKLITNLRKDTLSDVKYMREIFLNVLKSTCINYLKQMDYEADNEYIKTILECFNRALNRKQTLISMRNIVVKLSELNFQIMKRTYDNMLSAFGKISKTSVSSSSEKNKAILVGGDNLVELMKVLEACRNQNIDIYTNGNMLIAHAFEKFKSYPNLKAHFGNSQESMMLDFATFPGAILLTRRGIQNMEYLYRGRLFSSDEFLPKGIKAADVDYKNLIESANLAKGFAKGQKRIELEVGYDISTFKRKLDIIKEGFENNTYKKIIILGFGSHTQEEISYFNNFLKKNSSENFIISFSHTINSKNILHINIANNYAILSKFFELIFEKFPITSERIEFLLMKCDSCALSQVISLKEAGIKNIYLSKCPPTAINPSVLNLFKDTFGIKILTP